MSYEPKQVCIWCRVKLNGGGYHAACKVKHEAILADLAAKRAKREAAMTAAEIEADHLSRHPLPPAPTVCVKPECVVAVVPGSRYCPEHKAAEELADARSAAAMARFAGWCTECRGTGHAKRGDGRWDLDDVCDRCAGSGKAA